MLGEGLQLRDRILRPDVAIGPGRQTATLLVAAATLVLTVVLYIVIPKGFFPMQDTGVIQGISEAAQTVSFAEMSREAAGSWHR